MAVSGGGLHYAHLRLNQSRLQARRAALDSSKSCEAHEKRQHREERHRARRHERYERHERGRLTHASARRASEWLCCGAMGERRMRARVMQAGGGWAGRRTWHLCHALDGKSVQQKCITVNLRLNLYEYNNVSDTWYTCTVPVLLAPPFSKT